MRNLFLLVILALFALPTQAQVTLSADDVNVTPGETASIAINLSGLSQDQEVAVLQFTVRSSDPSVSFSGVDRAGSLTGNWVGVAVNPGNGLVAGFADPDSLLSSDGVLLYLQFETAGASRSNILVTDISLFHSNGSEIIVGDFEFAVSTLPVGVANETQELPDGFAIGAYPNPFNPTTNITLEIPSGAFTLIVYDMSGRLVSHVASGTASGSHTFQFDASALPSGNYLVVAETAELSMTTQITVAK